MNFVITKEDELLQLVKTIATVVLDDESIPTWSIASEQYYQKLANHILQRDPNLVDRIKDISGAIRGTYRSYLEYSNLLALVGCEKAGVPLERHDVCCVCLQPLNDTWQKLIRLRAIDDDPRKCTHILHKACAMQLRHDDEGCTRCPICREMVKPMSCQWIDHESKIPKY